MPFHPEHSAIPVIKDNGEESPVVWVSPMLAQPGQHREQSIDELGVSQELEVSDLFGRVLGALVCLKEAGARYQERVQKGIGHVSLPII